MKSPVFCDTHHLLWSRSEWGSGWCKELRTYWYCSVQVPRTAVHEIIHQTMTRIPPPKNGRNARDAMFQLNALNRHGALRANDPVEKRLVVLIALFECCERETERGLRRQLDLFRQLTK